MHTVDTLINARWIAPVTAGDPVLEHYSLAVNNGRIVDLLPQAEAAAQYQADDAVTLDQHLLIPGLINAHGHSAMTLFRGMADDVSLAQWLNEHIWPAEGQWVSTDFVADGVQLAIAELLLGGVTCFSDMYFFPDVTARIAHQHKIRAQLMAPVIKFPSVWAQDTDEYIHKALALHDDYRSHDRIQIGMGPHAPYTLDDPDFERIRVLADELDMPVQIHLHETAGEIDDALAADGRRPLQRLRDLGMLTPKLQCVHMTQVDDSDLETLGDFGCSVIHCPESNLKLASGMCPVSQLLDADINVGLGTDGAASNNDLSLIGEMRTAALLAKGLTGDAGAVDAPAALRMATINGAKALGLDQNIGSLEVGKAADITAVDLSDVSLQPVYNPVSQLVYACTSQHVSHVWIAGEAVVTERRLNQMNLPLLSQKAADWRAKISADSSN